VNNVYHNTGTNGVLLLLLSLLNGTNILEVINLTGRAHSAFKFHQRVSLTIPSSHIGKINALREVYFFIMHPDDLL